MAPGFEPGTAEREAQMLPLGFFDCWPPYVVVVHGKYFIGGNASAPSLVVTQRKPGLQKFIEKIDHS